MSEKNRTSEELEKIPALNEAYMNRMFCTTKERVAYVLKSTLGVMTLGKYDVGSDIWLYKIFKIEPVAYANARVALAAYDLLNDPLSAGIIDSMRTRWGKFKPFQYLAMIPSVISGFYTCFLPIIANMLNLTTSQRLWAFMILCFFNETINAFFGGGGYIDNVFTPNPNERTSLLVSAEFVKDLGTALPYQIMGVLYDLIMNGKINASITNTFVTVKTITWVLTTVPTIFWYLVSKERVPQSEKPPSPVKGIMSVFRNRPLLIYTLSGLIDGINIGAGQDLYFNDVLKFNTLPIVAGIPGSPVSYFSYALAPKLRAKHSTKMLWFFSRGSLFAKELIFFLGGLIGGKSKGLYLKKIPMAVLFAIGNTTQMLFHATSKIVGKEINYEVLDYCEWKNGFRVEATINLMTGYFNKVKDAILNVVNAHLLQDWAQYQVGETVAQTAETNWRLFIIAFGPRLIFDVFSFIPMLFYNIDQDTRERMYIDLERARSKRAALELLEKKMEE